MNRQEAEFAQQCDEAAKKVVTLLFSYPRPVAVCVLPGILAAVMTALSLPRETIISMLDSALDDMEQGKGADA